MGLVKIERRLYLGQIAAVTNNTQLVGTTGAPTDPPASSQVGVIVNPFATMWDGATPLTMRPSIVEVCAVFGGTAYTSFELTMAASRKCGSPHADDDDADTWVENENTQVFYPIPATRSYGDLKSNVRRYSTGLSPLLRFRPGNLVGGDGTSDVTLYVYALLDLRAGVA